MRAARQAGVKIALGSDLSLAAGLEIQRMVHHGLTPDEALVAATRTAAEALDLDEHIGTVTEGKLADLIIVDGDPLAEPHLLSDPGRIWLVLQQGVPVAGQALPTRPPDVAARLLWHRYGVRRGVPGRLHRRPAHLRPADPGRAGPADRLGQHERGEPGT